MEAEEWDRINAHIRARQFELSARLPISWVSVSRDLKHGPDRSYDLYYDATVRAIGSFVEEVQKGSQNRSPRILEGKELEDQLDSGLIRVYFLLAGYAIENLLKAILMIQHPEYFKPNAKLKGIKSHNLVNLCKLCNISLQQEEADLLQKLTTHIEWQGKYPIPLDPDQMFPIKRPDGTWKDGGEAFHGRKAQEEIDILYAKIWSELERNKRSSVNSETSTGA